MVRKGIEIDISEIEELLGKVENKIEGKIEMKVNMEKENGVDLRIEERKRWKEKNMDNVDERSKGENGCLNGIEEIRRINRGGNVKRKKIERNIIEEIIIGKVLMEEDRIDKMKNLRKEIDNGDEKIDRVGEVKSIIENDVRIKGLKMNLGKKMKELERIDIIFGNMRIIENIKIILSKRNLGKRKKVKKMKIVRWKEINIIVVEGEIESNVGNEKEKWKGIDEDILIRILEFGIEKKNDIRVMRMEVERERKMKWEKMVGIGKGIIKKFNKRNNEGRMVIDMIDRRKGLKKIGEEERKEEKEIRKLKRGIDGK